MHQSHKTSAKNLVRTSATPDVARHFPHQSQAYFSAFNLSLSLSKSNFHGQALTWTNQFGVEDTITSGWVVLSYDNSMMVKVVAILGASHWQENSPFWQGGGGHELRKSIGNAGDQ